MIERDVQIGVRATITATKDSLDNTTVVKVGATIGAGALIHGPLTIGHGAVIGPGSVVTTDVPAHAIVTGNPAAVVGYTQTGPGSKAPLVAAPNATGETVTVAGATMIRLPKVVDLRGSLTFSELDGGLPFAPRRMFVVYDVASRKVRGSHAHREHHQFLVAVGGQITVALDNGRSRGEVMLNEPNLALHIPPMVWATQYDYSAGATLVVLASAEYAEQDYIRDYDDYLSMLDE